MKHAKKLASLLLVLVMVFALTATAFADGTEGDSTTTGTITITNAVPGQTYTIYKILNLTYNETNKTYTYTPTTDWENFIKGTSVKDQYLYVFTDSDSNQITAVTWVSGADVAAFAKLALEETKTNASIKATKSETAPAASAGATTSTVTFSGLDLGYYLVASSVGAVCALDSTDASVKIEDKNEVPENKKLVQEDFNDAWGSVNDADIGDTVNFKNTIKIPVGAQNVVFHDEMDNGLTLNTTTGIKIYTDATTQNELDNTNNANYTVSINSSDEGGNSSITDGCTFEISFTETYLKSLTAETTLYIVYSATLNGNATVGGNGNVNKSHLSYGGGDTKLETPSSNTTTYTWSFDVLKYANGDETKALEGAKFVLKNEDNKVATIENGKLTGWVNIPDADTDGNITWPTNTTLTTDKDGKIEISGLDADTYYLYEIEAPEGYNILADAENNIKVEITPTTNNDGKSMSLTAVLTKVNNNTGTELPSTGGMGTTLFYVIGGILVVAAVVLLITKKRMSAEK